MIPFKSRLRSVLFERKIPVSRFCFDTGIDRKSFFYKSTKHHRSTYMAIAYYLDMTVEELVSGTDAEEHWYYR